MVPPELQLGGGDVLPQHRPGFAGDGERPVDKAGAGVRGRRGGRDGGGVAGRGAPLRVRGDEGGAGGRRAILRRSGDARGDAGGDRGLAGDVPVAAPDAGDAGDTGWKFCQEAVQHLPELPSQGKGFVPAEDEHGREGKLYGIVEDGEVWTILGERVEAGDHERGALAQHEVGVLHRGERAGVDPGAENRDGRGDGVRGERGEDGGGAHAAGVHAQHREPFGDGGLGDGDVGERDVRPGKT